MSEIHEGGCLCGAVRYRARNEPVRASICHCTVTWTLELYPGLRALAGGSFDQPDWLAIARHVWTRSKQKWFECPPGAEILEKGSTGNRPGVSAPPEAE